MKKPRNSFPSFMVISLLSILFLSLTVVDVSAQSRGRNRYRSRTTQNRAQNHNRSSSAIGSVKTTAPAWMRGVWYIPSQYKNGLRLPESAVGIVENRMKWIANTGYSDEVYYDGPFTIEGDKLIFNRQYGESYSYFLIDWNRQQLKIDEYTYITKKLTEEQLRNATR